MFKLLTPSELSSLSRVSGAFRSLYRNNQRSLCVARATLFNGSMRSQVLIANRHLADLLETTPAELSGSSLAGYMPDDEAFCRSMVEYLRRNIYSHEPYMSMLQVGDKLRRFIVYPVVLCRSRRGVLRFSVSDWLDDPCTFWSFPSR